MEKVQVGRQLDRSPSPVSCTQDHVSASASSGKFAWTHERMLAGKQAEHFPVYICKDHGVDRFSRKAAQWFVDEPATSSPQWLCQHQCWCPSWSNLVWKWSTSAVEKECGEVAAPQQGWLPPHRRTWNTVLPQAYIVCVGVDLHFVKENEIRGPVSTSLQFYYLQEPLPSCDALRNSLTHLQSM